MRKVSVATTIMPGHDHVSGLERLRGPVTVVRRCESLAELISVARAGLADVALVAGDTTQLTLTFLESIAADARSGRPSAVAAISDIAEERKRLSQLGVPVATPDTEPAVLAALLEEAAADVRRTGAAPGRRTRVSVDVAVMAVDADDGGRARGRRAAPERADDGAPTVTSGGPAGASPADEGPGDRDVDGRADHGLTGRVRADEEPDSAPEPSPQPRPGPGEAVQAPDAAAPEPQAGDGPPCMTAVWGPAGSPGRTTIAVNLAVELALSGRRTLLVDLDTYAASAGVLLGLLDESAGIAQACRLADQGGITAEGVERSAVRAHVAGTSLQVLTGLTRADRWPELRRAALDAVLAAAAEGWDEVVLDCGFSLEEDEELSFDVPAPQRNAATLAGLTAADRILALGTGDPVGLPRLVRGLDELEHAGVAGEASVEVIVNQVRADASGIAPQSQVRSVVERFGGPRRVDAFLPWDRKALDRALLGGQVLAEAAPKSALRRAVAGLAGADRVRDDERGPLRWMRR